jgi:replicative DNA helicase
LKLLAGELRCPFIALSQLNRKVENSNDSQKAKNVRHIRESSFIEQDAKAILSIYRDKVCTKKACLTSGVAEIVIAKKRNGSTATARLWLGEPIYTRFSNLGN